jgi:hypothetical protein
MGNWRKHFKNIVTGIEKRFPPLHTKSDNLLTLYALKRTKTFHHSLNYARIFLYFEHSDNIITLWQHRENAPNTQPCQSINLTKF